MSMRDLTEAAMTWCIQMTVTATRQQGCSRKTVGGYPGPGRAPCRIRWRHHDHSIRNILFSTSSRSTPQAQMINLTCFRLHGMQQIFLGSILLKGVVRTLLQHSRFKKALTIWLATRCYWGSPPGLRLCRDSRYWLWKSHAVCNAVDGGSNKEKNGNKWTRSCRSDRDWLWNDWRIFSLRSRWRNGCRLLFGLEDEGPGGMRSRTGNVWLWHCGMYSLLKYACVTC